MFKHAVRGLTCGGQHTPVTEHAQYAGSKKSKCIRGADGSLLFGIHRNYCKCK